MEKELINGIELLENIKSNIILDNTIIRVIKDNKTYCYLKVKDKDIIWKTTSKFRVAMLIDNNYKYEIISQEPLHKVFDDMGIDNTTQNNIVKYINSILYNI